MAERHGDGWHLTNEEYEYLREQSDWLGYLEMAGVDNWSGYDYAIQLKHGEDVDW